MSSDEDAPEVVSLQAGKAAFDDEQYREEQYGQLDDLVKKKRKQEKRKRESDAAKERARKLVAVDETEGDKKGLDLLPEDVVQAVLGRVG